MQSYQEQKQARPLVPRSLISNLLVATASLGIIAWSVNLVQTRISSVISRDAVINGVLIDIKTPSEGTVAQLSTNTGDIVSEGQVITVLKNERVSQLQIQEITSKLKHEAANFDSAKARLAGLLSLMETVKQDKLNQTRLENQEAQQFIVKQESELKAAQTRYRLATLNYQRTKLLATQGALPIATLDTVTLEMQERDAEVKSLQASLAASRTNQNAAQLSLSLNKTRSNYDPSIRQQELALQIAEQKNRIQILAENINSAQAELVQAQTDVQRQKIVTIKSPTPGVIWKMNAQIGKYVERGESIGQILDCRRRWVDVFVDEQSLRSIQPGSLATVELYGLTSQTLQGKVSLVRSGVGRLAAGEEIAIPISPNLARNTQVRVELDAGTEQDNSKVFCYVGYTGKVTFKIDN
jgi:multidrug resistance efflux pump